MPKDKFLGGLLPSGFSELSCLSRYQSVIYRKPSPHKPSSYLISKLRSYEALHKRCGPYTEPYNRTLNQLKPGRVIANNGCKYVVHLWMSHSGLGNRLLSLASSFLYAVLTKRVLLIDQGHNMNSLLCEPFPETTWVLPSDFPIKNQFNSFDKKSPNCYGNMLTNKTINTSMDKSLPSFMYLNLIYDYDEYDKHFFCDKDQGFVKKVPWLILRSDQYFIPSLFLIPSFEKQLTKLFPKTGAVFHHLGRYLFHPTNRVWGLVTRYYQAYLAKSDERIGIQIRDFGSTNLPFQSMKDHIIRYYLPHLAVNDTIFNRVKDSSDLTNPLTYMMDRILDCSLKENLLPKVVSNPQDSVFNPPKNPKTKAVLITSLNSWYYEEIRNTYWQNPTSTGELISVYQPSHEEFQQIGNPTHDIKALAEIYLLSLMDVLVTSPWSTFGYVAQGLGALKPWVLNNPHKEMNLDLPCHRARSMEPCFHFPPFYDCEAKTESDTGARIPYVGHCEDTSWGLKLFDDH
ncbi:Galactoside 2-alpha-L-fucosyltransferase [Actinidia chinensis var. chinensis]|uniref:Fucosyltransferase n=1 Tax=Actinidia chinensis var. chinensis TaxID=1590841 RepID=A0A2R6QQT1_ACTCC|nr:Galactoside 2-alpha-L-fucosyltransferase [Actinidia chinensis var. chinensis]